MAATIVTVAQISDPSIKIQIKINNGHPVPTQIIADSIMSFRTWKQEDGHIFVWTNSFQKEMSMIVPNVSVGWILSSMPVGIDGDRFRIDSPCIIDMSAEVLPV